MTAPSLVIRAGHPDFLDLPWHLSVADWQLEQMIDLPKGISRHEVRFVDYPEGIYAIKELPAEAAGRDYAVLRALELRAAPAVTPVGIVENRHPDRGHEFSAALITRYVDYSFSYRQLLAGPGFGARRNQMLDAFAGLLVQLHLAGCFWGDCSLSNVLYRFDAENIETIMGDAETAFVVDELSKGRRQEDLEIMIENVAGGMADIAAEAGHEIDEADLELGEDIADRYRLLWEEVTSEATFASDEHYRIKERMERLNSLGFDVEELDLVPTDKGERLRVKFKVSGRNYHSNRFKSLTGVEALEFQARQILTDLHYFHLQQGGAPGSGSLTSKELNAVRWRVGVFEPMLQRLRTIDGMADPVQAFCDLLYHRYALSQKAGHDVGTEAAFDDWVAAGRPGYPLE